MIVRHDLCICVCPAGRIVILRGGLGWVELHCVGLDCIALGCIASVLWTAIESNGVVDSSLSANEVSGVSGQWRANSVAS